MKKSILTLIVFLALGVASLQAQWKVGANAGVPVGDMKDAYTFNAGADVAYLFGMANLEVGPMVGYSQYFAATQEEGLVDNQPGDVQFIPVAASGRVSLGGTVFVGADLGYAFGIGDEHYEGVYYRPKLGFGFYGISVVGSYSGVNVDAGSFSTVNVGLEFSL